MIKWRRKRRGSRELRMRRRRKRRRRRWRMQYRVPEEQNENDGIDFDRDGGTLGNRASGATLHLRSAGFYIYSQCSHYIYSHIRHFTFSCLSTPVQQTLHNFALEWLILIDKTQFVSCRAPLKSGLFWPHKCF